MGLNAIILGSSGLVGGHLLDLLLQSKKYSHVKVFVRRPLDKKHQKLEQIVTDFSDMKKLEELITADVLFSCLGSTKKKTPDKKDYIFVDKTIPETFIEMAALKGLQQLHLVSAIGADSNSTIFYNQLKGELEDIVKQKQIPSIHIYQPSLIMGNRNEFRLGECIASALFKLLNPLMAGSLKKYRSIAASTIAEAMYQVSLNSRNGIYTYTTEKIKELA